MTESSVLVEVRKRDSYLQLREGRLLTFKDTVWESLLGVSPEGIQERWAFLKKDILKVQEQTISVCCRKTGLADSSGRVEGYY